MTRLSISDMSCRHCKATVEQAIKPLDPAATLDFDMVSRMVSVETGATVGALRTAQKAVGL